MQADRGKFSCQDYRLGGQSTWEEGGEVARAGAERDDNIVNTT